MRLQLEKQLLFLSLLCIVSKKVQICQEPHCHLKTIEDDEEGCEVNGRIYRDGEVFQPSCKIQCHCLDGGFNCIPLCQEDVRLPTPDCPHPRRVEIPGKCCPEWICETQDQHLLRDARAAPGAVSPLLRHPCQEWGTEWSACSATCGLGFATRVSNQNRYCRLETQRRLCMLRPCPALPAAFPVSEGWVELLGRTSE
ncbi:WNT1 inducible signaling pathway protein 2 [Turdus rufiventris]|nr:WNT1 inducible signaling pathway protein 2 [Turdus rufiventris]